MKNCSQNRTKKSKDVILKEVTSLVGSKGASNMAVFWIHNPLASLYLKSPLSHSTGRNDEAAFQMWHTALFKSFF